MKLIRVGEAGAERPAVHLDETTALDVSGFTADFDGAFFAADGPRRLAEHVAGADLPRIDLRETRIGPPIARPGHVLAIGRNYVEHAEELGNPTPGEPIVFSKAPNAVVGPYDDVLIPPGSEHTDWEVELAVVIGRRCRYLSDAEDPLSYVAGYCVANDVSEREWQRNRGGQWIKGKSAETFNPLGPWLVTPDEVGDPQDLALGLDLNGERQQDSSTRYMIFGVGFLIRYLSQFMVLEPGDLINTGTPAGVGMGQTPPRFLRDGDMLELWVEKLGRQRTRCRPAT